MPIRVKRAPTPYISAGWPAGRLVCVADGAVLYYRYCVATVIDSVTLRAGGRSASFAAGEL